MLGDIDKLWFSNGREIFLELFQTLYLKIKIWSTFFKGCGVGKAHNILD